jgi:hypothetical protein
MAESLALELFRGCPSSDDTCRIAIDSFLINHPNCVAPLRYSLSEMVGQAQLPPFYSVPVPLSATVCGLAPPLSITRSVAFFSFLLLGAKVTPMVQLPPFGTLVPQVLVWAKALRFVPAKWMPPMFTAAAP